jgi:4-hydroxythreonine-4-phosphate dehydrogenase
MNDRPIIAITIGDPAGVGPEVVLKALAQPKLLDICCPLVVGDADLVDHAARQLKVQINLKRISNPDAIDGDAQEAVVLHMPGVDLTSFQPGMLSADSGEASLDYLECAIDLTLSGKTAAIATGPINKVALHLAGSPYRGHTQLLADRCGVKQVSMMLLTPGRLSEPHWLRVSHATTHIALKDVPAKLTPDGLRSTIRLTHECLQNLGLSRARLAVAGLNPHAGDGGLMGEEELLWIQPLVAACRIDGFDVEGPLPADTVFLRATQGEFDAVVALYHDQGHIAVKMHGFENAVNMSLGLPIIRTSVDHGTAFDIAWQGRADPASMIAAIELAATMAAQQQSKTR